MAKINPEFSSSLKKYGGFDQNACYNCGNCTAVCSLSTEEDSFPREMVRNSVLGLEDEIETSLKPWLCYYCGECSSTCPREANPGELMMTLRRWLTAKYDWTGLSGILYRSLPFAIVAFIIIAIGVVLLGTKSGYNLEELMQLGHHFEFYAIIGVFVLILLPNIIRMWYYTIAKSKVKIPLKVYFNKISELFVHMFTQKRTLDCDDGKGRWFLHLILVLGYLSLLFTTIFLGWFSTDNVFVIALGYIESAIVFLVTIVFVSARIVKKFEVSKKSQPSDWMFVVWLFLMGLTAFMVRMFIDLELIVSNQWIYIIHMMILAQWALIIVPFGKWPHFLYRSFAMYFHALKKG